MYIMQCFNCQAMLPLDARFCPMCGAPQQAVTGPTQRLVPPNAVAQSLANGLCPKCGSTEIYVDERGLVNADRGGALALTLYHGWRGRSALISTYICGTCGYIELYAAEKSLLPEIIKNWRRVVP